MDLPIRTDLIRCYYESHRSPTNALRKYCREKKLKKRPCTVKALIQLVRKFESLGSVQNAEKSGRPSLLFDRESQVKRANSTISRKNFWRSSSVRKIARKTGIPKSSVHNILKKSLRLKPYAIRITQKLEVADFQQRMIFAEWFLTNMSDRLNNVLWTDEAYFHLDGVVYTRNCYIWAESNPFAIAEKPLHPEKICVWTGFSGRIMIPPFFIETGTIDGDKYLSILQNHVVPYLKRHHLCFSTVFKQDGAPPHIKNTVKDFLKKTFGEQRIISRHLPQTWPPRSPDLSPVDFWYWGALKQMVYENGIPDSLLDLKERIIIASSRISLENVHSALDSFLDRLHMTLDAQGQHVEHLL
jgi:hypothetical protein